MARIEFEPRFYDVPSWHEGPRAPIDMHRTLLDVPMRQLVADTSLAMRDTYRDLVDARPLEVVFAPERRVYVGITVSFVAILLLILINGDRR